MDYLILIRCFLIGILASSSFGPIFILTFNRGAIYGFFRGFATALGACIADGIYFFLGLIGVLAFLQESKHFMFLLDTVGGIFLIVLGLHSIKKARAGVESVGFMERLGFSLTMVKSFLLTVVNPLVLLFFLVIAVQILPEGINFLPLNQVVLASCALSLGSLFALTTVALIASFIGGSLSRKNLKIISFISGLIFIGVGIYLLDQLVVNLIELYKNS